jgi:hypothetical protein
MSEKNKANPDHKMISGLRKSSIFIEYFTHYLPSKAAKLSSC